MLPTVLTRQVRELPECIENKRKELIELGMTYGFADKITIKCSQDLDKLIYIHMYMHAVVC
ncbi:aspartyl-phosphate phosphatase Spo0E family protein [Bacillus sp. AFS031507]|uniref:aspartyl-phosphate phosphatase Spo0E family protein n=1 Tax=Bacillus sp. AFS031507 TaxID=2033496 RepID=UPI001156429D|nr:aspartyl-phosphate phosphatase Spo0E family protein [Bacillus sp. AFS031507]